MKESKEVVILNLDDILPNRFQPRIKFDEKAIVELSESIKEHGVIQPIIVRKISDKYEIIAGERRYKASVMAGKTNIPAIVVDLDDKDSSEIALIENVQRKDLTPIEEAISYRKILDMGYLTQDELATKLGVAQSTVANKLRLLNLDDDVQDALLDEKISERHARSLLKLEKPSMQKEMLKRIINERLTVRKTDEEIDKMINNTTPFDSIENNMNQNINNSVPSQNMVNNNPFIIENNVMNNQEMVNEEPINIKPANIEVLDFNDFAETSENSANKLIEETPNMVNTNIPSMPIIEDTPINDNVNTVNNASPFNYEPYPSASDQVQNAFSNNMMNVPHMMVNEEENIPSDNQINQNNFIQNNSFENNINVPFNSNEPSSIPNNQIENTASDAPSNDNENSVELKPGRFFNILNTDAAEEEENTEDTFASPSADAANNIFNQTFNQNLQTEPAPENNTENNSTYQNSVQENATNINPFNYASEPVTPYYEQTPQNQEVPEAASEEEPVMNLRDVINMVRDCADKIEKNNFEIDTEEFDFDDMYQIIFKIKK